MRVLDLCPFVMLSRGFSGGGMGREESLADSLGAELNPEIVVGGLKGTGGLFDIGKLLGGRDASYLIDAGNLGDAMEE